MIRATEGSEESDLKKMEQIPLRQKVFSQAQRSVSFMANKRRGGRKGRRRGIVAVPFQGTLALATLADGALLSGGVLNANFSRNFYAVSVDVTASKRGGTVGEGPILYGWAHSDLSDTEMDEKLEAENSAQGDIIANERAKRPVRLAGVFSQLSVDEILNNGMPVRTPLRFTIQEGFALALWAKNRSGVANLTTGCVITVTGTIFGRYF